MTPIAVHRPSGLVLFDDGATGQVTDWMDANGDPCDPGDACACVAHSVAGWWAIDLRCFETVTVQ